MVTFSADEVRAPPRKTPNHTDDALLDEPKTDEECVVNIMLSPAKQLLMRKKEFIHDAFDENFLKQVSTDSGWSVSECYKLKSCPRMMKLTGYQTRAEACEDRFLNLVGTTGETSEHLQKFLANQCTYSEFEQSIAHLSSSNSQVAVAKRVFSPQRQSQ